MQLRRTPDFQFEGGRLGSIYTLEFSKMFFCGPAVVTILERTVQEDLRPAQFIHAVAKTARTTFYSYLQAWHLHRVNEVSN